MTLRIKFAAFVAVALLMLAAGRASWATRMGMQLANGPSVTAMTPAGYARVIGLELGDRIVSVNGQTVGRSARDFETVVNRVAAERPQPWVFTVERAGRRVRVTHAPEFECNPFDLIGCGALP